MEAWMYESNQRGSCKLVSLRGVWNARAVELLGISLVLTHCALIEQANNNQTVASKRRVIGCPWSV